MSTEPNASFGYWVRRRRKALDLTQEQLAERTHCSVALIRKIEIDERRPSSEIAAFLAKALSIPNDEQATFLKVARGERATSSLAEVAIPQVHPFTPPPKAALRMQSNLPIPPNPLVGRGAELTTLRSLLRDATCRLLTINGAGGMGKTRLALALGEQVQAEFADGVFFVNLAAVTHSTLLTPAIAVAIGLNFSGPLQQEVQLLSYLRSKQMLLLLDNFEHLLDGVDLIAQMLATAPAIKVLATSREPLGLQAEWVFTLDGLSLASPTQTEETDQLASALELFVQRAKQTQVSFRPTPENVAAIQQICQLMEGMPLGIELAATWVRVLSCQEIAQQIEQSVEFLVSNRRDLPVRHRSMNAVFDHSWQLLSGREQAALAQLSVFQSGFTREAAQVVSVASLHTLSALVGKSLVRMNRGRYDLHELVRQFAAAQLASRGATEPIQQRHASYFLGLLHQREAGLQGVNQVALMTELQQELGNIRKAWAAAGRFHLWNQIFLAVRSYWAFFDVHGLTDEGSRETARIIQQLENQADSPEKQRAVGRLLCYCGYFHFRQGDHPLAHNYLQRSITVLRTLHEPALLIDPLVFDGVVAYLLGNPEQAQMELAEGLALAQAAHEDWFVALALLNQGYLASFSGANNDLYQRMQRALAIWRRLGGPRTIALALAYLGAAAVHLKLLGDGQRYLDEALPLAQQIGDLWLTGTVYSHFGLLRYAQGELAQAEANYQQAIAIFETLHLLRDLATAQVFLSDVQMARGTLDIAHQTLLAGLRLAHQIQATPTVLAALLNMVALMSGENVAERLKITLFVLQHPVKTKRLQEDGERFYATLVAQLTPAQIVEIEDQVSRMTLGSVVAGLLE